MKRKLLAVIGFFAMLLGLLLASVFAAAPVSAQVVGSVPDPTPKLNIVAVNNGAGDEPFPNMYLPIFVFANGQPSPMDSNTLAVLTLDSCCLYGNQS